MEGLQSEDIYEALFDDEALARLPFLLAEVAKARSALMLWQHNDGCTQMVAHTGLPWFESFPAYANVDPYYAEVLRSQNTNRVLLPNDWITRAAFERTVIFNELIRAHGDETVYCAGAGLRSAWGSGAIGVHRGRDDRPFDSDDAKRLGSALVHAGRVLRARGEILSARRATTLARDTLHALALALIVVRADLKVVDSNDAGDRVLRRADGLAQRKGRLCAVKKQSEQSLVNAIAKATARSSPMAMAVAIERRAERSRPYLLTVTPLVGGFEDGRAVILFRDPSTLDESLPRRLAALFGLSAAEAEIATQLGAGRSASEISATRRVSEHTLRGQLKSIMAKMHCHRQSEIAAIIATLPPVSR